VSRDAGAGHDNSAGPRVNVVASDVVSAAEELNSAPAVVDLAAEELESQGWRDLIIVPAHAPALVQAVAAAQEVGDEQGKGCQSSSSPAQRAALLPPFPCGCSLLPRMCFTT
jgi:hypothetical protein